MSDSGNFIVKVKAFWDKIQPVLKKIGEIGGLVGLWAYRLRKIIMAAPVLIMAIKLAADNMARLPEIVGLNLQSTGEFARMISRNMAVNGPLMLTLGCLAMMFLSRKALYSWAISVFTLALPILLLLSNMYPA